MSRFLPVDASQIVISCEHATNRIPTEIVEDLNIPVSVLNSHRGWDPGAKQLAAAFGRHENIHWGRVGRLLIDLNRSESNPTLFSEWSKTLSEVSRKRLLETEYWPYRNTLLQALRERLTSGMVLHLSCHTFTPVFNGVERTMDIGLLFDPSRERETTFCCRWKDALEKVDPSWRIAMNAPYAGTDDGLTTLFRKALGTDYLGMELEVNQGALNDRGVFPENWVFALRNTFEEVAANLRDDFESKKPC